MKAVSRLSGLVTLNVEDPYDNSLTSESLEFLRSSSLVELAMRRVCFKPEGVLTILRILEGNPCIRTLRLVKCEIKSEV